MDKETNLAARKKPDSWALWFFRDFVGIQLLWVIPVVGVVFAVGRMLYRFVVSVSSLEKDTPAKDIAMLAAGFLGVLLVEILVGLAGPLLRLPLISAWRAFEVWTDHKVEKVKQLRAAEAGPPVEDGSRFVQVAEFAAALPTSGGGKGMHVAKADSSTNAFMIVMSVIVLALIAAGVAYDRHEAALRAARLDAEEESALREELRLRQQVRSALVDSYLSVRLGMEKKEVRYLLGDPSSEEQKRSIWVFESTRDHSRYRVSFDKEGRVRQIACSATGPLSECPALGGVELGHGEWKLRARFGVPHADEISDAGLKTIAYVGERRRVEFTLKRDAVETISISSEPAR